MLLIPPLTKLSLGYRAYHVAAATRSSHIVALAQSGAGHLVAPDGQTTSRVKVPDLRSVALHPDGTCLAATTGDELKLLSLPSGTVRVAAPGQFEACAFSPGGDRLWTCRTLSSDRAILELRSLLSLEVLGSATFQDPFEESSLWLTAGPHESLVSIWVAAGQDGQVIVWGRHDGTAVTIELFEGLQFTTPPSFDSDGDSFLVIADDTELRRYAFPQGSRMAAIPWPFEDEEDMFGSHASFAGHGAALVTTNNGRLYLCDLDRQTIVDEVAIAGHEPGAMAKWYPSLKDETGLCSDMSFFLPLHQKRFLSIHHQQPFDVFNWKDDILTWEFRPAN